MIIYHLLTFFSTPNSFSFRKSIMGEDDIVELLWKRGQVVRSSQTQGPSSDAPPILRGGGSGSGGGDGDGNAHQQHHENLFIQEDEMVSWLHQPLHRDDFFYSTSVTHMQSSESLAPPPPLPPYGQTMVSRRPENFTNFSRLRCNISAGAKVDAGPSMELGSSATPLSSVTGSSVIPTTKGIESRVSRTFAVPGLGQREIETICEGTPSSGVCKAETELIPIQPVTETQIADDRKRKEREETISEIKETEETRGSTSRKRSRATEMHNVSERRRREKINEKMKTLQELIPRCNKSDRASMLDDAIEYMKSLQMQVQMMSMGQGMMPQSMMYGGHMQQLMPQMAMGMMSMSRPPFLPFPGTALPRPAPMPGLFPSYPAQPYPFTNVQTSDPSRVYLPTPQPNLMSDQPQFPTYMNPYTQFVGLHQMQPPPPPLQSQTTSQLSCSQASSSKELEDQDKQPGG